MKQRFENISMNGRMAYVIMCVEAWLQGTYPDRDWTMVSEAMWKATEMNWGDWPDIYVEITSEIGDDSEDELNYMLTKPHEMAMVYEGTGIGDGMESLEIIAETEDVLKKHDIPLPDFHKVEFSSFSEKRGWGKDFDGRFLSIIL